MPATNQAERAAAVKEAARSAKRRREDHHQRVLARYMASHTFSSIASSLAGAGFRTHPDEDHYLGSHGLRTLMRLGKPEPEKSKEEMTAAFLDAVKHLESARDRGFLSDSELDAVLKYICSLYLSKVAPDLVKSIRDAVNRGMHSSQSPELRDVYRSLVESILW